MTIEIGDLRENVDSDPIHNGDDKFTWGIAITVFIGLIVIVIITILLVVLRRKNTGNTEPYEEEKIAETGEIESVVIEGQESDFPHEE